MCHIEVWWVGSCSAGGLGHAGVDHPGMEWHEVGWVMSMWGCMFM